MSTSEQSGSQGHLRYQVIPSGSIACNAIALWHDESHDAVIIDPTDDARVIVQFARQQGLNVHHILLTHGHFDHAADAERAMRELECPASIHADDLALYLDMPNHAPLFGLQVSPRTLTLTRLLDQQIIDCLPQYPIEVMHVPGHSAGSVAFHIPDAHWLSAGDTLFRDGVGRTDLPGGSMHRLIASIQHRLYSLPEKSLVIPGHGPMTTIGRERHGNPFVRAVQVL